MNRQLQGAFKKISTSALLGTVCFTAALSCMDHSFAVDKITVQGQSSDKISGQEALSVRRIIEFWKDQDYGSAKKQILTFLDRFKDSKARDQLLAMLGDLYINEGNNRAALESYEQIQNTSLLQKTALQRAECYFELKDYDKAFQAAGLYSASLSGDRSSKLRWHFLMAESLVKKAEKNADSNEKNILLQKALENYSALENSPYQDLALFSMAEIYIQLDDKVQASDVYEKLAKIHPENQEALLFQAARCLYNENPLSTARILGNIASNGGQHAEIAAYDQMQILFKNKKFEDFLSSYEKFHTQIPKDKESFAQYMAGKSQLALGNRKEAAELLKDYAKAQVGPSTYLKSALNALLNLSAEDQSYELADATASLFSQFYPQDKERAEALVLHAQLSMQDEKYDQAMQDIDAIMTAFPNYHQREALSLDKALLLYYSDNFEQARSSFSQFIEAYPHSSDAATAMRLMIHSSISSLQKASAEDQSIAQNNLIDDLTKVFSHQNVLSESDQRSLLRLYFDTMLKTGQEKEALVWLQNNSNKFTPGQLEEAQLIHAQTLVSKYAEPEEFVSHGEEILKDSPQVYSFLHIPLYNNYISLARKSGQKDSSLLLDKAAEHLFAAFNSSPTNIQSQNLQWLADYYYIRANDSPAAVDNGLKMFNHLVNLPSSKSLQDPVAHEENLLKIADLLEMQSDDKNEQLLLEDLCSLYQKNPNAGWKFQKRAYYQLGQVYEAQKNNHKALELYQQILAVDDSMNSYFSDAATLQCCKILYATLSPAEKKEDGVQIQEILQSLKDLQIKSQLVSEPLHIEAAVEYASIRGSLVDPVVQKERKIFFLKRILDDYNSKDFLSQQDKYPQQCELLDNYLSFIQAEIVRLEGEIASGNLQNQKALDLKSQAKRDLDTLSRSQDQLTPYLFSKIQESLEALR